MLTKSMVKNDDGTPMKKEDFRIIREVGPHHQLALCLSRDLPDDLKAAISRRSSTRPTKDKEAFEKLSDGKNLPLAADHQRTTTRPSS